MFNKKSKTEAPKDAMQECEKLSNELERTRNDLINTLSSACLAPLGFSPAATTLGTAYTPPGYTPYTAASSARDLVLNNIQYLVQTIHDAVCRTLNDGEAVARLIQVLEDRKCPTDDCKKCKYYVAGGVDKCDTNRMLAEYLVLEKIVKVSDPKPIDKEI